MKLNIIKKINIIIEDFHDGDEPIIECQSSKK